MVLNLLKADIKLNVWYL
ncbi:hypothetical protein [Candidatus Chlorohelix allophototropha]